jgi:hypothetical protein
MGHRKQRGEAKWTEIVCAQQRSGLSARAYCVRESIAPGLFYKWRGRLQNTTVASEVREVHEPEVFIDMGKINSGNRRASADNVRALEVMLDFGDGLLLTVRRG